MCVSIASMIGVETDSIDDRSVSAGFLQGPSGVHPRQWLHIRSAGTPAGWSSAGSALAPILFLCSNAGLVQRAPKNSSSMTTTRRGLLTLLMCSLIPLQM